MVMLLFLLLSQKSNRIKIKNARYTRAATYFGSITHNIRKLFPHLAVALG